MASAALTGCDWSAYIDSSGESLPVESPEDPKPSAPQEEQGQEAEPSEVPDASKTLPEAESAQNPENPAEGPEDIGEPTVDTLAVEFVHKDFSHAEEGYFDDALFIGDSRTVGLNRFGGIEGATWYCDTGLSIYNCKDKILNVEGKGETTLEDLLLEDSYGKIYIGMGINELGYDMNETAERYAELLERIKQLQSRAVIILMANIHVAPGRNNKDKIYNNKNINKLNEKLKAQADGVRVYYIDPNPIYDDENGNLKKAYTSDDTHFLGKYYPMWTEFIKEHAIQ